MNHTNFKVTIALKHTNIIERNNNGVKTLIKPRKPVKLKLKIGCFIIFRDESTVKIFGMFLRKRQKSVILLNKQ